MMMLKMFITCLLKYVSFKLLFTETVDHQENSGFNGHSKT